MFQSAETCDSVVTYESAIVSAVKNLALNGLPSIQYVLCNVFPLNFSAIGNIFIVLCCL